MQKNQFSDLLRVHRLKLEDEITAALDHFTEATGVTVADVRVQAIEVLRNEGGGDVSYTLESRFNLPF
jgi:regulator of protease activity HflC (stomatin/prohibitin superfamily)